MTTMVHEERLLLTVAEVADRLRLNRSAVYVLLAHGEISSVKIGRARRVPVAELDRYITRLVERQRADS